MKINFKNLIKKQQINKAGIGSVSDISKMKDKPKEKDVSINIKQKIPQETNNQNKNKKILKKL